MMSHPLFTDTTFEKKDFREALLEKGEYENCKYAKCILSSTDLSSILFIDCAFMDSDLSLVNLAKTCFRDAVNYSIDPEKNKIKKARFSSAGIAGLLDKYDIDIA
jgi:uncharacterized protein YjbI with pentapeptide repeats